MVNQHFFQPLLPGFHSHLTIPLAFCSKHVERRKETRVTLRSDASYITWKVKIEDGRKLTDGWKEFALAHDLRVGDIVIFRQEKDMAFHVTLFGPSCCEIQYGPCLKETNKLRKIQSRKKAKKNLQRYVQSSSLDRSCFVNYVRPSSLLDNRLTLPKRFVRENGLETRSGEIVLINEKGRSWTLTLTRKKLCGTMLVIGGWNSFCSASGLRVGSFFAFKLIKRGKTLVLLKTPSSSSTEEDCLEGDEKESDGVEESNQDEKSFKKPRLPWKASTSSPSQKKPRSLWKASTSSPSQNLFVTLTLKSSDIKNSRLFLPVNFTRLHGINKDTKMIMLDKNGVKWSTDLRSETSGGDRIRLIGGWKEFFKANCVEIGESIIVKLIWKGDKSCVLKYYSKVKQERTK